MNSLKQLREASKRRQTMWDPDKKITPLYRSNELGGEVGEALNVVKKLERARIGISGSTATVQDLADELADVVICVDLLAAEYGIDLDVAIREKFNKTSKKMGFDIFLD